MDHISAAAFSPIPTTSPAKPRNTLRSGSVSSPEHRDLGGWGALPFRAAMVIWRGLQNASTARGLLKRRRSEAVGFLASGSCLREAHKPPREHRIQVDAWGLPTAHIELPRGENERRLVAHMQQRMGRSWTAAGGRSDP